MPRSQPSTLIKFALGAIVLLDKFWKGTTAAASDSNELDTWHSASNGLAANVPVGPADISYPGSRSLTNARFEDTEQCSPLSLEDLLVMPRIIAEQQHWQSQYAAEKQEVTPELREQAFEPYRKKLQKAIKTGNAATILKEIETITNSQFYKGKDWIFYASFIRKELNPVLLTQTLSWDDIQKHPNRFVRGVYTRPTLLLNALKEGEMRVSHRFPEVSFDEVFPGGSSFIEQVIVDPQAKPSALKYVLERSTTHINRPDSHGYTPLMKVCGGGDKDKIEKIALLLAYGADLRVVHPALGTVRTQANRSRQYVIGKDIAGVFAGLEAIQHAVAGLGAPYRSMEDRAAKEEKVLQAVRAALDVPEIKAYTTLFARFIRKELNQDAIDMLKRIWLFNRIRKQSPEVCKEVDDLFKAVLASDEAKANKLIRQGVNPDDLGIPGDITLIFEAARQGSAKSLELALKVTKNKNEHINRQEWWFGRTLMAYLPGSIDEDKKRALLLGGSVGQEASLKEKAGTQQVYIKDKALFQAGMAGGRGFIRE